MVGVDEIQNAVLVDKQKLVGFYILAEDDALLHLKGRGFLPLDGGLLPVSQTFWNQVKKVLAKGVSENQSCISSILGICRDDRLAPGGRTQVGGVRPDFGEDNFHKVVSCPLLAIHLDQNYLAGRYTADKRKRGVLFLEILGLEVRREVYQSLEMHGRLADNLGVFA